MEVGAGELEDTGELVGASDSGAWLEVDGAGVALDTELGLGVEDESPPRMSPKMFPPELLDVNSKLELDTSAWAEN